LAKTQKIRKYYFLRVGNYLRVSLIKKKNNAEKSVEIKGLQKL
jgi:hypothetical protein